MSWIDEAKAWFLARWLKRPPEPLPKPQRPTPEPFDPPVHIDRHIERCSDPKFQEIDLKVRQAISNVKAGILK